MFSSRPPQTRRHCCGNIVSRNSRNVSCVRKRGEGKKYVLPPCCAKEEAKMFLNSFASRSKFWSRVRAIEETFRETMFICGGLQNRMVFKSTLDLLIVHGSQFSLDSYVHGGIRLNEVNLNTVSEASSQGSDHNRENTSTALCDIAISVWSYSLSSLYEKLLRIYQMLRIC